MNRPNLNLIATSGSVVGLRRLLRAVGLALLGLVLLTALAAAWLWTRTPDADGVALASAPAPSRIVAADGTLLDIIGPRDAHPVTLEQVSPHLVAALIATEDRRFHEHGGLDLQRVAGAAWATVRGELQGGSTLTQQLARNLFPQHIGSDRSVWRKLREAAVALKIEQAYSKREILAMYLNHVPFLYNVTGVEMAARTYFDKAAADLDRHEAALLVAMLKGPSHYDPVRSPERARQRRDLVLSLLARHDAAAAQALPDDRARPLGLRLRRHDLEPPHAPHFVQQVRRQAQVWADARGLDLSREGLTVVTTLDPALQALAQQAVQRQGEFLQGVAQREWTPAAARGARARGDAAPASFGLLWRERPELLDELVAQTPSYKRARQAGEDETAARQRGLADTDALQALQRTKTRLEAAFVAMEADTGAVRAYVGSRDAVIDRYDHVSTAQRQPGSTFKPFVYGAALRAGLSPYQTFLDEPPQIMLSDGRIWSPGDGGQSTGEPMTLRAGLSRSRNSITAQVAHRVGVPQVVSFARNMGVERATLEPVPSIALGTSPVSLMEMVRAYGTLASLGVRREPVMIERIVDRHGLELERFDARPQRVLDEAQAVVLVDMLREAVDQGTGRLLRTRYALRTDLAGKTGTTQRNTDGWFIALRPGLVAGAWVGFNDPRVTMRGDAWGQGGRNALLIVGDFLRDALDQRLIDGKARFPTPPAPPVLTAPTDEGDGSEREGSRWDGLHDLQDAPVRGRDRATVVARRDVGLVAVDARAQASTGSAHPLMAGADTGPVPAATH